MEIVSPTMRKLSSEESLRCGSTSFQMPLHYPRYTMDEYEEMPELKVDRLLADYGLKVSGDLAEKRRFAEGAFIWPTING